jgi:hypothetical protein
MTVNGAAPPVTFSVISGAVPPGLNLGGATLSGTPATAGAFTFTVRAMDSTQDTASRQFSITIDAADPAESDGNGCMAGYSAAGSLMPALAVAFATFRRRRRT